jgi:hypothetical protein
MQSLLSILGLIYWAVEILLRKVLFMPMYFSIFPWKLKATSIALKSLIHFEWIFTQDEL